MFRKKTQTIDDLERFDIFSGQGIVAVIVFLMMLILIGFSWRSATQDVLDTRETLIRERIEVLKSNLNSQVFVYDTALRAGAGLFKGSTNVSRDEWKEFSESIQLPERYKGVLGIGYAEVLAGSEVQSFEAMLRSEGFSEFKVFPNEKQQAKYVVTRYFEPLNPSNFKLYGFDLYSNPERRETLEKAAATRETSITEAIVLVQDQETPQSGLVAYFPYAENDDVEGYIYIPFRSSDLFENIFETNDNTFTYSVYDSNDENASLLYSRPVADSENTTVVVNETLKVFDKEWKLSFSATDEIVPSAIRLRPKGVLIGGIIFSLIVAIIVYLLLQRRARLLMDKKQREVEVAKDDLLSLASHQLRTPATGVKQYIGMVLEGFTGSISDNQRATLERAYQSNERQLAIINEFLYLAKADADRIVVSPQRLDIRALLQEILNDMESELKASKHTLHESLPTTEVYAFIDRHSVRMAIENIISNAIKYTPAGGDIFVTLKASLQTVKISVQDTGVGIDRADFSKLFKQFSRIPNELTQRTSGSGIGLYLARQLIKRNNGDITVTSTPGEGSTFTIALPVKSVRIPTAKDKAKR